MVWYQRCDIDDVVPVEELSSPVSMDVFLKDSSLSLHRWNRAREREREKESEGVREREKNREREKKTRPNTRKEQEW